MTDACPYIPVCSLVQRNPFGKEWAVLAIRNLCDNNLENQAEIAKLQPQQVQSVCVRACERARARVGARVYMDMLCFPATCVPYLF